MPLNIRRVVTGHDQNGRAIVAIDETCRNVISGRRNHASCVVWSTGEFPAVDYAVVVSGEIDMEMDGTTVHLAAGDVLVQRGTIHNWINRGTKPCVIAFVLIAAKPVERSGKILGAMN